MRTAVYEPQRKSAAGGTVFRQREVGDEFEVSFGPAKRICAEVPRISGALALKIGSPPDADDRLQATVCRVATPADADNVVDPSRHMPPLPTIHLREKACSKPACGGISPLRSFGFSQDAPLLSRKRSSFKIVWLK